jgi:hypothetical protein
MKARNLVKYGNEWYDVAPVEKLFDSAMKTRKFWKIVGAWVSTRREAKR